MSDSISARIVSLLKHPAYRPLKPRALARELELQDDANYPHFKQAVRDLEEEGVIEEGAGGGLVLAKIGLAKGEVIGKYSGNKRGFGFIDVTEPHAHPQLFVPEDSNPVRAVTGDIVKAKIFQRYDKQAGDLDGGRITSIIKRAHSRIAGTLRQNNKGTWFVEPEGNVFTDFIFTPDAAGKYLTPGVRVIVELTQYPTESERGQGVVAEVLGEKGEKDVDLKMILVQHNLPEDFPDDVKEQARAAIDRFDSEVEKSKRLDFTDKLILTIDPDDAKDYDDAISLERDEDGNWDLGVHIADVSFFVTEGTPLDVEAQHRGNSIYFPGYVVPMLPEVLSNGVCSLQEKVDRLTKSAFITIDGRTGKPLSTRFSNTIIRSSQRLRYREAQALIDNAEAIPHPNGTRKPEDYATEIRKLLADMNHVARLIQKRRQAAGQLVLDLPKVDLVLDQTGKVVDAKPEDDSFTHTLIEMFMVEANEAVGRLFNRLDWPAIRRIHPDPDPDSHELQAGRLPD
ncbi:MAG TPA: RNB domain-containing ribonuclease, partial [Tepidisphaeraceae bacterium]|nr:RNB domain-containing ribonuclease [Tepidisphaeraceae bacterium]